MLHRLNQGWGKSTLLSLAKYYRALLTNSLRNPKQFLKLSESTRLTDITVSFTKATAYDLVIKPMINILETSPMCERLRYERDMNDAIASGNKIYFCNTSNGNSMIRIGDIYFDVASDPMDLVGRNIVSTSATELAFLSEKMSEEKVMKLLTEMITRVYNRFGYNNPNTTIVVDSSPNSMEGQVDQWVAKHCRDKDTMFINDSKWSVQPYIFPIWEKDHSKIFPMFKGTSTQPAKVITEEERKNYDENDIMDMPIDLYELAKDNPSKILRDFGACPTAGSDSKLIQNTDVIERMFVPNLKNIYMYEYASYLLPPENLLWNKVKDICCTYTGRGNLYILNRNPRAERFIHMDLAESHDMASVTMLHLECNKKGEKIYVVDFTLPILCKKNDKINIDAFKYLVKDLRTYGQVNIKRASYDRFQSSSSIQYLERIGIETTHTSVDISPEPYLSFLSYLLQGRIKMGRNLIIKNNCKSLVQTNKGHHGRGTSGKLVIDHTQGEWMDMENQDWETSKAGINGKDATDSLVGAIVLADEYGTINPEYLYDYDEEKEIYESNHVMESIQKNLSDRYGLVLE